MVPRFMMNAPIRRLNEREEKSMGRGIFAAKRNI